MLLDPAIADTLYTFIQAYGYGRHRRSTVVMCSLQNKGACCPPLLTYMYMYVGQDRWGGRRGGGGGEGAGGKKEGREENGMGE